MAKRQVGVSRWIPKVDTDGVSTAIFEPSDADLLPDRTKEISKPRELETWTRFTFPGRDGKYSDMVYTADHFSGVDYDSRKKEHGVFRLGQGKNSNWALDVSKELGNYDYLSVDPFRVITASNVLTTT
jgi:hypothetical protein